MKESTLVRAILQMIRARGHYAVKTYAPISGVGTPDIHACVGGLFLAIEVKTPKTRARVTKAQRAQLGLVERAGGEAHVVTSVEEAEAPVEWLEIEARRRLST